MPMTSPDVIVLSDQQQARLAGLVRALTSPQRLVLRARVVLLAAADTANAVIAGELGICIDTVRKWRHRWATRPEVGSLTDAHRSGRKRVFTPVQIAQVGAVACSQPASCDQVMDKNPTHRPAACSGSSTTAAPTAAKPPSTGSPGH